ncbi:MAG: NADH-quinone oxidoreductase subunit NuoK [Planctomycetes bacterium]|nr:NADH-quinone oxidoreductase subunit NuoK [Planctomycetota bacterium]
MQPLAGYVFLGTAMFVLGVFTMVTRKNAIYVLMGAELILNAAALNFVAFARYMGNRLDGQMFAIFIIILAAAEAAVALGIVLQIHHHFPSIDVSKPDRLGD